MANCLYVPLTESDRVLVYRALLAAWEEALCEVNRTGRPSRDVARLRELTQRVAGVRRPQPLPETDPRQPYLPECHPRGESSTSRGS